MTTCCCAGKLPNCTCGGQCACMCTCEDTKYVFNVDSFEQPDSSLREIQHDFFTDVYTAMILEQELLGKNNK